MATEALVNPKNAPWMDGPADVTPLPTGRKVTGVPLRNYLETEVTVLKANYPNGHVLIVRGNPPPTEQAVLKMVDQVGQSYQVTGLGKRPYEYGVVVFLR